MAQPPLKEIYGKDLMQRFPDHSFEETVEGSMTRVDFKDAGDVIVGTSLNLDAGDAYKIIRENVVGFPVDVELHNNRDTVQTTDNTATTIATIPLPDETTNIIHADIIGIEDDNSNRATYDVTQSAYRTGGGNATLLGTMTTIHEAESAPSWGGPSFTVSGNDLIIQIQGASITTVNWVVEVLLEEFGD